MNTLIANWLLAAAEILEAELSHPVEFAASPPHSGSAPSVALVAEFAGEWRGSFTVFADETALGVLFKTEPAGNLREKWQTLFRKIAMSAAESLSVGSRRRCEVAMISAAAEAAEQDTVAYQMRSREWSVALRIADRVQPEENSPPAVQSKPPSSGDLAFQAQASAAFKSRSAELLLDVELEASLRFGSRELLLNEVLELGPGDVVQLDRHVDDAVDLIIGDKIVARGEVVLVNGNFGLQILEVAEPVRRLESIRCLF